MTRGEVMAQLHALWPVQLPLHRLATKGLNKRQEAERSALDRRETELFQELLRIQRGRVAATAAAGRK